jgi:hypothetical protein
MSALNDLEQQLRRHGIESVTDIEQAAPTAITECFAKQVSGGATSTNTTLLDCHYNFSLTNADGSGTFGQSNC